MARANPPPIKVPKDEKLSPTLWRFLDKLAYSVYLLWVRSGKGGDTLEIVTKSEALETSAVYAQSEEQFADVEQIEDQLPLVEPVSWVSVEAGTNYTAVNRDVVQATAKSTITLDPYAETGSEIITTNSDGTAIKVNGGGYKLKYRGQTDDNLSMLKQGTSIHWFFLDSVWLAS